MKTYNMLWFDDEYKVLELIYDNALINGITLIGYDNAEEGLIELEKNIHFYDAVIVDGKFYKKPGQSGDAVDDSALGSVAKRLIKLEDKKVMPWFILSGQISFTKEINKLAEVFKGNKVYDKNSEDDIQALWNDIKREADLQIDTQIRHKYKRVFESCTEKYIGLNAIKDLLEIIKFHDEVKDFESTHYFATVRKIMEDFRINAIRTGLISDSISSLNELKRLFVDGKEKSYILPTNWVPKVISNNLGNIIEVSQDGSHRLEIDKFVRKIGTPYLLYSITYQLLDILIWFKMFVDENMDIDKNKRLWENTLNEDSNRKDVEGIISKINEKGFAHLNHNNCEGSSFIPKKIVTEFKLKGNERAKAKIKNSLPGKTEVVEIIII